MPVLHKDRLVGQSHKESLIIGLNFWDVFKPGVTTIKFIYSEKATKFCEISTVDLSYVVPVKSTVEILQNFVAFLEYIYELYIRFLAGWSEQKSIVRCMLFCQTAHKPV